MIHDIKPILSRRLGDNNVLARINTAQRSQIESVSLSVLIEKQTMKFQVVSLLFCLAQALTKDFGDFEVKDRYIVGGTDAEPGQ